MNRLLSLLLLTAGLFTIQANLSAQFITEEPNRYKDFPMWIEVPQSDPTGYGVYYFRKEVNIDTIPQTCKVNISADNRYNLYVNSKRVSIGPARSDFSHWSYEQIDIAPYLKKGNNIIAAQVWNEGQYRAEAFMSKRTAFMMQSVDNNNDLNSNASWLCIQDKSYTPLLVFWGGYIVVSPGETIDMHKHISNWKEDGCDMKEWKHANPINFIIHNNQPILYGSASDLLLQKSTLPQMELTTQRLESVRKSSLKITNDFLKGSSPITIPANTETTILLDQHFETNAYPTLVFSKGNNATISLTYAETLYNKPDNKKDQSHGMALSKGNRNEVEGKIIGGRKDSLISNGSDQQKFTSLIWRTYRYIEVKVKTAGEPLVLNDIYGTFTGYPFKLCAGIDTNDEDIHHILEIGWRTARLCANETYMDCPYYEQLQYLGDSRIQALITLYNTSDDRLVKKYLDQSDESRRPEGITLSRYPTANAQIIPGYSLIYILALHDYMMYGSDSTFVKKKLPGMHQILSYFENYQQQDGRINKLPGWNFIDWVNDKGWNGGEAPKGSDGCSASTDLLLMLTYEAAAELEHCYGLKDIENSYRKQISKLKKSIEANYWDAQRGMFADDAEHNYFSQHTNALAILADVVSEEDALNLGKILECNTTIAQSSVYFSFYLHEALAKAGLGDNYTKWLDIYRKNINAGLTTWAEVSDVDNTRSDCHAWGSSPNIELYRILLGITSASPGFQKVRIAPCLGNVSKISGKIPHPNGMISVQYEIKKNKMMANITLPNNITGIFVWKGKKYNLHPDKNIIHVNYKE